MEPDYENSLVNIFLHCFPLPCDGLLLCLNILLLTGHSFHLLVSNHAFTIEKFTNTTAYNMKFTCQHAKHSPHIIATHCIHMPIHTSHFQHFFFSNSFPPCTLLLSPDSALPHPFEWIAAVPQALSACWMLPVGGWCWLMLIVCCYTH